MQFFAEPPIGCHWGHAAQSFKSLGGWAPRLSPHHQKVAIAFRASDPTSFCQWSDRRTMSASSVQRDVQRLLAEASKFEDQKEFDKAVALYRAASKLDAMSVIRAMDESSELPLTYRRMPAAASDRHRSFAADAVLASVAARDEACAYFERHGYIVFDGALDAGEIRTAVGAFTDFMRTANECDVTSADSCDIDFLGDRSSGIVSKRGVGSSRFLWYVRSRQKVKDLFRAMLFDSPTSSQPSESAERGHGPNGSAKLICSFDGCNWMRNPETKPSFQSGLQPWFHFDAGDNHSGRYVQGLVNLIDNRSLEDAGLVVLPGSHHALFPHIVPATCDDPAFLTYLGPVEDRIRHGLGIAHDAAYRVPAAAGSLVLWKSTVLHCNAGCVPREGAACEPRQLIRRLVAYVCMMPDPGKPEVTEARREALKLGRTTCHQPDLVRWVGDIPRAESVTSGAVITKEDLLPDGALELI